MTLVAELFYEAAGIKVRPARAMLMNIAVIGELRSPFVVKFRQRAGSGKLQDDPEQRVGIGRTPGKFTIVLSGKRSTTPTAPVGAGSAREYLPTKRTTRWQ